MIVVVVKQSKKLEINQKTFGTSKGIRTHCVSAAMLYQPSYEEPYIGVGQFFEFILPRGVNCIFALHIISIPCFIPFTG